MGGKPGVRGALQARITFSEWRSPHPWGPHCVSPGVLCVQVYGDRQEGVRAGLPVSTTGRGLGRQSPSAVPAGPSAPCMLSLPGVSSNPPHLGGEDAEAGQGSWELALPHKMRRLPDPQQCLNYGAPDLAATQIWAFYLY